MTRALPNTGGRTRTASRVTRALRRTSTALLVALALPLPTAAQSPSIPMTRDQYDHLVALLQDVRRGQDRLAEALARTGQQLADQNEWLFREQLRETESDQAFQLYLDHSVADLRDRLAGTSRTRTADWLTPVLGVATLYLQTRSCPAAPTSSTSTAP